MKSIFPRVIAVAAIYVAGIAAAQAQIAAGPNRPATVPAGYVITPFGYFHSSCVAHLAEGDELQPDRQSIRHANGTAGQMSTCAYPHYRANGQAVSGDEQGLKKPDITGWIESASATTTAAYGSLSAEWSVPNTPSANDGQTLYYFPGLEDINHVVTILQPVLGWNSDFAAAWGIASWNCCQKGTVYEAKAQPVSPGDTIYGVMNCVAKGKPCRSWNVVTTDMRTGKSSRMLRTSGAGQTFNWAFGGVLEVYTLKQCTDFPSNGSISFHDIQLVNKLGQLVAKPNWSVSNAPGSLTPQCSYSAKLPAEVILGAVQ